MADFHSPPSCARCIIAASLVALLLLLLSIQLGRAPSLLRPFIEAELARNRACAGNQHALQHTALCSAPCSAPCMQRAQQR